MTHAYHIHITYISHTHHIHVTYMSHTYHINITYISHIYHIHTYHIHNTYPSHTCHIHITYIPHTHHIQITNISQTYHIHAWADDVQMRVEARSTFGPGDGAGGKYTAACVFWWPGPSAKFPVFGVHATRAACAPPSLHSGVYVCACVSMFRGV